MLQKKSTVSSFPMGEEGCFLCIDKPKGPTSHQVDHWVREITGVEKVGHVGTLDPQATGLLVMAMGKAVRLVEIAHEQPKEYIASMKLHSQVDEKSIRDVFNIFTGTIYQLPPLKSAVVRRIRPKKIYELEIMEIDDRDILFRVKCESGTYVRTLCLDIGYILGTRANMTDLRRTSTLPFTEKDCITLQQLSDYMILAQKGNDKLLRAAIYSPSFLFSPYPKVVVKDSAVGTISHGSDLYPGGLKAIIGNPLEGDRVGVFSEGGKLVGTGKMLISYNQIMETKIVDFDRVLVDPGPAKHMKTEPEKVKPEVRTYGDRGSRPRKNDAYSRQPDRNHHGSSHEKRNFSGNERARRPEQRERRRR
ncbi:MAG: RNA-guided pseudouridylation complex pseudouridine synthase subunit Cbf5 [Candidatus Thermoplasmatota archaeon]|nr:RNA-guided pseudouridylation complex pseudouridine synthase subunit Cbf5 [Candidatus Thermoplasmatota archaeon]MCL5790967.1 RNA-guided pseudouridylation complex pseudouridine synthase subunit Cbf5 [Candidatus Thermoplasmatota archaeon]